MAKKKEEPVVRTNIYLQSVVMEVMARFEIYLPSPQAVALFRRKLKEYAEEIAQKCAGVKEGVTDGRDDNSAADGDAN